MKITDYLLPAAVAVIGLYLLRDRVNQNNDPAPSNTPIQLNSEVRPELIGSIPSLGLTNDFGDPALTAAVREAVGMQEGVAAHNACYAALLQNAPEMTVAERAAACTTLTVVVPTPEGTCWNEGAHRKCNVLRNGVWSVEQIW